MGGRKKQTKKEKRLPPRKVPKVFDCHACGKN